MYFGISSRWKRLFSENGNGCEWKDLWIICMAIAVWIRKSFSVRRKGICRQIARRRLVCGTGDCKWESYLGITMH